ncbi:MAG: hypothetical protein L0Y58_01455 [Verrucomicrobia subdivision 3 bacterium]|nr:hypothetical protein [Limisphaerales bacterium]
MKTTLVFFAVFHLICFRALGAVVTLSVGDTQTSDSVSIDATQVADLKSFVEKEWPDDSTGVLLEVQLTNRTHLIEGFYLRPNDRGYRGPLTIRGPATISLRQIPGTDGKAFSTFAISPEAFPADKAITIPAGTGGAQVTLESSTDLVNWASATNGVYTNLTTARFFRIRADRLPP